MSAEADDLERLRGNSFGVLLLLALVSLLSHFAFSSEYGIFRDELYYVACSDHLAWGYVDHPPLSIVILATVRLLFGDSLFAIRLTAALAGASTVFLAGLITREVGGGRFAQALAALAVLIAPIYLAVTHLFSMNAFEVLLWAAAVFVFVQILNGGARVLWLVLGAIVGLGLLNKYSMSWLIAGLFAGLVLTPQRKLLATKGPWLAAAIAAIIFMPHIIWEVRHDWPTVEFMHNATTRKMVGVGPLQFFVTQVLVMNPVTAPIWIAGLLYSLFGKESVKWRPLGYAFLAVVAILLVAKESRPNYLSSSYSMLLPTGALAIERLLLSGTLRWPRGVALSVLVLGGAALLPYGLPVLPVKTFIAYSKAIGIAVPQEEHGKRSELPQHFADMFGWPELAEAAARVYDQLPAKDRAKCAIYASNYGEAGAIDYFGGRYGLPKAICGHNSYWHWGPEDWSGEVVIIVNGVEERYRDLFESVQQVDAVRCEYSMPYEQDAPIYVARGLRIPVDQAWQTLRNYIYGARHSAARASKEYGPASAVFELRNWF